MEHSFWFSGYHIAQKFNYAAQSFKSQKHINITLVMKQVETAFNNASDKEGPAWLIQWVIKNKLVCNITLDFLVWYWHLFQKHK